jgi:hypothetical protein
MPCTTCTELAATLPYLWTCPLCSHNHDSTGTGLEDSFNLMEHLSEDHDLDGEDLATALSSAGVEEEDLRDLLH